MRAKSLILLVVALGCGMIAAVGVSKTLMNSDGPVTESTTEIFVAVKDLLHGQAISAENVKLEKWPSNRIPEGALRSLEQIEGKFSNQSIFAGEPLLEKKISDSRETFSTRIPTGFRIFDIEGSAGYIKPGDHVDIVGTFESGGRNSIPETRTVMRNVQVFGIDGITTRDSESSNEKKRGSIFQLLVKETQVEALTLAENLGDLRLNLRPFGEGNDELVGPDNGETFISWVRDSRKEETVVEELPVSTNFVPSAPAVTEKNSIIVRTPEGFKKYEWVNDTDVPEEVLESAQVPEAGRFTSSQFGGSSSFGNVSSEYGGYAPTYPNSGATNAGGNDSAAADQNSSDQGDLTIE